MDFGFEKIMNIDKLDMVGEVMDENMDFQIFLPSEKYSKRSNSMVFGFQNIMDFAIDIDKLNLANLLGKVMNKIMEYQMPNILPKCTER